RWTEVGVKGSPEYDSIWESPPKSWITSPVDPDEELKAGKVQIVGVAMGGMSNAKKIEVSTNGGKDWKEAEFVGLDLGKYAWRQFAFEADLDAGTHELACRVTNEDGDTQPEERRENNRGYLNNSWRDHAVEITVA
ncbi:MAG TPA: sulfite oxidase, partial [Burkholderiaceae bacterium]|nr:sulfite oxidase [Burkholderiaceae bacterium]